MNPAQSLMDCARCESCRFYFEDGAYDGRLGGCRRNAPVAKDDPLRGSHAAWPKVAYTDWCGAYEVRKYVGLRPFPEPTEQYHARRRAEAMVRLAQGLEPW